MHFIFASLIACSLLSFLVSVFAGAVIGLERTAYTISEGETDEVCVEVLSGSVDSSDIDLVLASDSGDGDSMWLKLHY